MGQCQRGAVIHQCKTHSGESKFLYCIFLFFLGSTGSALWTETKGTGVATADCRNASRLEWERKVREQTFLFFCFLSFFFDTVRFWDGTCFVNWDLHEWFRCIFKTLDFTCRGVRGGSTAEKIFLFLSWMNNNDCNVFTAHFVILCVISHSSLLIDEKSLQHRNMLLTTPWSEVQGG